MMYLGGNGGYRAVLFLCSVGVISVKTPAVGTWSERISRMAKFKMHDVTLAGVHPDGGGAGSKLRNTFIS